MNQFEQLLEQLKAVDEEQALLVKSLPAVGSEDVKSIQAGGADKSGASLNPEDLEESDLTKSLNAQGVGDPNVAEDLIKSLEGLSARVSEQEDVLAKGLTAAVKLIQTQGEMIKSLGAEVAKLGNLGAGRKAAITLHEGARAIETPLTKSSPDQMTTGEFLAKSEAAWKSGKITSDEFNTIDVSLRQGLVPATALATKVLS